MKEPCVLNPPVDRISPPRSRRITLFGVLAAVLVLALGAGVIYTRYFGEPKRFAVVRDRVLYRSAQPKPAQVGHVIDHYGIKTIIIAREGTSKIAPDEAARAEQDGAAAITIPIESRKTVPDDQIARFFDIVDDPARQPVWVHCSAGRHRTGLLCALYRIERQGWSVDQALAELESYGFDRESQSAVYQQLRRYKPGSFPANKPLAGGQRSGGH